MTPTPISEPSPEWSKKRAIIGATFAAVLTAILGAVGAALLAPAETDFVKLGQGMGRLIPAVFLIAFAGSYLWQTGRKPMAYATFTLAGMLGLAPVVLPLVVPGPPPVITKAERADFEIDQASGVLTQTAVGLSLGSLDPRFVSNAAPSQGRDVATWLWLDVDQSELVAVVVASSAKAASKSAVEGFVGGVTKGMLQRGLASDADFEANQPSPDIIEGRLQGIPFRSRGIAYSLGSRHYLALVIVVSKDATLRSQLTSSLKPL